MSKDRPCSPVRLNTGTRTVRASHERHTSKYMRSTSLESRTSSDRVCVLRRVALTQDLTINRKAQTEDRSVRQGESTGMSAVGNNTPRPTQCVKQTQTLQYYTAVSAAMVAMHAPQHPTCSYFPLPHTRTNRFG